MSSIKTMCIITLCLFSYFQADVFPLSPDPDFPTFQSRLVLRKTAY